jgi:hypothetical protein
VSRSAKPPSQGHEELDSFFSGLDEMRARLERHNQDPAHRHERLGRLATDLLKPREPRLLARWLTQALGEALGATGAALQVRGGAEGIWTTLHRSGAIDLESFAPALRALPDDAAAARPLPEGVLVPLLGIERVVGVLLLCLGRELDDGSVQLVTAMAATAGVALEQGLTLEALAS